MTARFTSLAGSAFKTNGAYSIVGKTGTMAAGLSAASPVGCFVWDPTTTGLKCLIDRISVSLNSGGTGFTAGVGYIEAVAARSFTTVDYGGKAAVSTTSAVASESGGTLSAGDYFYSVSALGAWGETALGTERTANISGSTGSITVTYSDYAGATAHRIWRGTTTGVYTHYQADAASTFVDTGAGWTAGTPGTVGGGGTGLTLTTNNAKLDTNYATTELAYFRISDTITMLAGTRTLDSQPFAAVRFGVGTATNTVQLESTDIWNAYPSGHPLVLGADEGIVFRATVPATGTWEGVFRVEWREGL